MEAGREYTNIKWAEGKDFPIKETVQIGPNPMIQSGSPTL